MWVEQLTGQVSHDSPEREGSASGSWLIDHGLLDTALSNYVDFFVLNSH